MIKKQALSLLFSLLFSSLLVSSATAETQTCTPVNRPIRIAKSTASLMGYAGLTVCSGMSAYICASIASDKFNILGIIGLVPSCYGLWGGAKGTLSSIKEISRACYSTQPCTAQCTSDKPVTA